MQTCKGKTKAGSACRAPACSGGLCFFHANPDSAKTLGQVGGRKNRRSTVDLQIPENLTATELCKITGNAIRSLLAGELRARDASALAQLCNSLYRIIPGADLEARDDEGRTPLDVAVEAGQAKIVEMLRLRATG